MSSQDANEGFVSQIPLQIGGLHKYRQLGSKLLKRTGVDDSLSDVNPLDEQMGTQLQMSAQVVDAWESCRRLSKRLELRRKVHPRRQLDLKAF
jgi:hypothetical protein